MWFCVLHKRYIRASISKNSTKLYHIPEAFKSGEVLSIACDTEADAQFLCGTNLDGAYQIMTLDELKRLAIINTLTGV